MRIKDVIRANKKNIRYGGWKNGAMPKSVFPLGKSGKNALNLKSYEVDSLSVEFDQ